MLLVEAIAVALPSHLVVLAQNGGQTQRPETMFQ
jgi:hypothetical protein